MRNVASRLALWAAALLVASVLLLPSLASAQMREFTGQIDAISKKKMIVDNRMGDKVSFVFVPDVTVVEGEKTEWDKLKKKDRVTVHWKFVDRPRKAYKVVVLPAKEEEEDEE
jgi:hypothetical protein